LSKQTGPNQNLNVRIGGYANTIGLLEWDPCSDGPSGSYFGNRKAPANPSYCVRKITFEEGYDKINIRVTEAHVAYKATGAVISLVQVKRRMGIAVLVPFWPPAAYPVLRVNGQTQFAGNLKDGHEFLNPREIWPLRDGYERG
jgi:hypothetical protein